jgi:hypothetical protein
MVYVYSFIVRYDALHRSVQTNPVPKPSMKKLFATLAVLIGAASPVHANPTAYQALNRSPLTQMVERTGTRIVYDTPLCYERGMLGYYRPSTDVMGICVENHKGDWQELGDTLRHESIHVAQACNGGKPILQWNQIAKYSNNRILSIVQHYPAEHQHIEYEAFTAAYVMNNNQIAKIVAQQCSHLL